LIPQETGIVWKGTTETSRKGSKGCLKGELNNARRETKTGTTTRGFVTVSGGRHPESWQCSRSSIYEVH